MYAIADIHGLQYKIEKGATLRVPLVDIEVGKTLTISEVLLVSDGEKITVGTPFVEGATVTATVTSHDKYDKVMVFKKKRRKDYSVKRGHRQDFTEIMIDDIALGKQKAAAKAKPKAAKVAGEESAPVKKSEEKVHTDSNATSKE